MCSECPCVAIVHNGIVYIGYWLGTGILYQGRNGGGGKISSEGSNIYERSELRAKRA